MFASATLRHILLISAVLGTSASAETVSATSDAGTPLFDWETKNLTPEYLARLEEKDLIRQHASLFKMDDSGVERYLPPSGFCKSFPGNDLWPSSNAWKAFGLALGDGALIETIPIGAVCYQGLGAYDKEECDALLEVFALPRTHEADPTSIMFPLFQGLTCMPENGPDGNCTLGGFPVYSVNVSTVAQVQLAVNFARNANVRLVIKNTGHCYLGKSSGAGALSVWTHNLKDIEYIPEYDGPGYQGPALKVGAGVTVKEVYEAADKHDGIVLGGICESVGFAGGYIAGGGHTPMSGIYGMAADHIMALEVVTATGEFVTASPETNKDLYWALRGGGGGTYGVVTSVIVRVHPKISSVTTMFTFRASGDKFWQGVRKYFSMFVPLADAAMYSYFWVYPEGDDQYTFDLKPIFAPNHTLESFQRHIKPWFDELESLGIEFKPNTRYHESFYEAYSATWLADADLQLVGSAAVRAGNHLFPQSVWASEGKFNATLASLRALSETGHRWGGYNQAPRNRANADNAVSPAFRNLVAFLISASLQPAHPTPDEMRAASRALRDDVLGPWREIAPPSENGGSYLNEADVMEPDWQASFYGAENYERLLEVKRNWDPTGVFYATTGVGSEDWEVKDGDLGVQTQNGRLCRV